MSTAQWPSTSTSDCERAVWVLPPLMALHPSLLFNVTQLMVASWGGPVSFHWEPLWLLCSARTSLTHTRTHARTHTHTHTRACTLRDNSHPPPPTPPKRCLCAAKVSTLTTKHHAPHLKSYVSYIKVLSKLLWRGSDTFLIYKIRRMRRRRKMHTIDPCGDDSRRGLRLVCLMLAENHSSCAVNLFVHSLPPVHDLFPSGLLWSFHTAPLLCWKWKDGIS